MKIKYYITLIPSLLSLLLLQNCGQEGDRCEQHEPVHTNYYISNTDKAKIPFTGTDTLVYISTDGDTATLYGQGKKVFMEKVAENNAANPGCPRIDYNYFENIEFVFKSNHPILKGLVFSAYVNNDKDEKVLMRLNTMYRNYAYKLKFVNYESHYKDSVEIKGTIYYGFTIYSGPTEFLYNWKYGFLSLYVDGRKWKLHK